MRTLASLLLLCFVCLGQADVDCETLVKPIHFNHDELRGKFHVLGGSSYLPGSRTWAYTLSGVWAEAFPTSESDVFDFTQAQRMFGTCLNIKYKMSIENGALVMKQPEHLFYLKDEYLPTDCPGCVTLYETATSGNDTFYSLLLFSKTRTVPDSGLEMLKKQAACLKMPSVIMLNKDSEPCPEDPAPMDGAEAFRYVLEAKMSHFIFRIMDAVFDMFVN